MHCFSLHSKCDFSVAALSLQLLKFEKLHFFPHLIPKWFTVAFFRLDPLQAVLGLFKKPAHRNSSMLQLLSFDNLRL